MASLAAPARARPAPRREPARRPRREPSRRARPQARARPRLAGGVLWIAVVAALLAGIVALNVAVLRLNLEVEQLERQRDTMVAQNDALASELSTAAAAGRVEDLALRRLGLVAPTQTTYVELERGEP